MPFLFPPSLSVDAKCERSYRVGKTHLLFADSCRRA
jgi:hypothetical protein